MKISLRVFLFMAALVSFFPGSAALAGEITVSAAISLKNAFQELGRNFEARAGSNRVHFNFGASGDLARQIESGAPVDVFASAAQKDMDVVEGKGFLLAGTKTIFAENEVVLIVPVASSDVSSFDDLTKPAVLRIAVGNPKTVPAGRYASEVFDNLKIAAAVKDKLIYAENVRQVLDYVGRGEVDAGVVYLTDSQIQKSSVRVVCKAPAGSHKPVHYPVALLKESKARAVAAQFIEELLSPAGKAVLRKYSFTVKE